MPPSISRIPLSSALLADDEPHPLDLRNGDARSDFILICEHAGRLLPRSAGTLGLAEEDLSRHIAWDIGARDVATALADELGAPLFLQRYSRLFCDCNRKPHVPSFAPEISEATIIPGNRNLTAAERQARADAVFWPFHQAVAETLDIRRNGKQRTLLVTIHSFTPIYRGRVRPWEIAVMFRNDRHLASAIAVWLKENTNYYVGVNEPYQVTEDDYAIPIHGESRGLPCVEFEIRNDLIGDRKQAACWAALIARALRHGSAVVP
jgi:predicted N-formylglutamate amidohydrolase